MIQHGRTIKTGEKKAPLIENEKEQNERLKEENLREKVEKNSQKNTGKQNGIPIPP